MLQFFSNLSIKSKILITNGITCLFLFTLGGYCIYNMNTIYERGNYLYKNFALACQYLPQMDALLSQWRIQVFRVSVTSDPQDRKQALEKEIPALMKELDERSALYDATAKDSEESKLYAEFKTQRSTYFKLQNEVIQLTQNGQEAEAKALMAGQATKTFQAMSDTLAGLTQYNQTQAEKELKMSGENYLTALISCVALGIIAVLVSVVLSLMMASKISNPLIAITQLAKEIAQGNLQNNITPLTSKDELGQLSTALHDMVNNLRQLIGTIKDNANSVASSSEELSATSAQMRQTAEQMTSVSSDTAIVTDELDSNIKTVAVAVEQSSANIKQVFNASGSLERSVTEVDNAANQVSLNLHSISAATEEMSAAVNTVATAVEEMTASLNEVSKNAGQAARVAMKADECATSTRSTVSALENSAREIENVVELIKGIASQTNLLALNATIEAASAGEAGKGFAVVANEVKELAKQSAEATEDIRRRIEEMQNNTGSAIQAISEISTVIGEINQINNTIASAVEEQTSTASEISRSVSGAAEASSSVSKNVQEAALLAELVTKQVQEANSNVVEITRNLEEVTKGSNEISQSAGQAATRASQMAESVTKVSRSSSETEDGAQNVQATSAELAKLAASLERTVAQFTV